MSYKLSFASQHIYIYKQSPITYRKMDGWIDRWKRRRKEKWKEGEGEEGRKGGRNREKEGKPSIYFTSNSHLII